MYLPYRLSSCNIVNGGGCTKLHSVCRGYTKASQFNLDTIYDNHSWYEQPISIMAAYGNGQYLYSSATTLAIHLLNRELRLYRNNRLKPCLWGCLIPVDVYQKP